MKIIFNPIAVLSLLTLGCGREGYDPLLLDPGQVAQQFPPLPEQQFQENFEEMIEFDEEYHIQAGTIHFEGWWESDDLVWYSYSEVVHFDEFGRKERCEYYYEDGTPMEITINNGLKKYTLDMENKIAKEWHGNYQYGIEIRFDWVVKSAGGWSNKVGDLIVDGKDCEVFKLQIDLGEAQYAGWKNIILSVETTSDWGNGSKRAIEFLEGAPDSTLFIIPEEFTIDRY